MYEKKLKAAEARFHAFHNQDLRDCLITQNSNSSM